MKRKLILTYVAIILITVLFSGGFAWNNINRQFIHRVENEAKVHLYLLEEIYESKLKAFAKNNSYEDFDFEKFAKDYAKQIDVRITIIGNSGVVYGDSVEDYEAMDNHKGRPEIREAIATGFGASSRNSKTTKQHYYYIAKKATIDSFESILRIAVPVYKVEQVVFDFIRAMSVGLLIGIFISTIVSIIFSRRFTEPIIDLTETAKLITKGNYDNRVYIHSNDEVGELADAFNTMTKRMRNSVWELEEKNAELESVLSSMEVGLAAIDEDYKILLHNEPFRQILGLEEEINDTLFYEVIRNSSIFSVVEKSVDEGKFVGEETKIIRKEKEYTIRISSNPIRVKSNVKRNLGVLILVEDVTQLRKLETIRRDFVSNVTHELKTPLTSIKGFVETLKAGALQDEKVAGRFLDIIEIEAERLTGLIDDILSLSEIENTKFEKNRQKVDIGSVIEEVFIMLQRKAEKKEIRLEVMLQEDMKEFQCNRDRMKQLLINLIDNGIKYTEQGAVTVYGKMEKEVLILSIQDTGIGIDEEHIPRLFERFYRVDKGRSRKMGGTGLGLSIVKHIVELYNGTIQVESKMKEGTIITIKMPYTIS